METKNLLNKKITQWLLLVAMLVGCSASIVAANRFTHNTIYLKVKWSSNDWSSSGAHIKVHLNTWDSCGGDDSEVEMSPLAADNNYFYADVSSIVTSKSIYGIKFVRRNDTDTGDWNTVNCMAYNSGNAFELNSWTGGNWTTYTPCTISAYSLGGYLNKADKTAYDSGADFAFVSQGDGTYKLTRSFTVTDNYFVVYDNCGNCYGVSSYITNNPATLTKGTCTQKVGAIGLTTNTYYNITWNPSTNQIGWSIACTPPTAGSITASPASPICKGTSTTLTIAGYTAGSTLQWYKGSSILTDETSESYSTEDLSEDATYKVVVSNNGCTSETAPITINVQEPTLTIALTSAAGGDKVYVWEPATFTPTTDGTITDKTITRQSGSGAFIVEDGANDAKIVKAGKKDDVFRASFTTNLNGCTKTVTKEVTVEKAEEVCQ